MKPEQLSIGRLDPAAKTVTVIMAGGSGTRFWPMSRAVRPKQFLPLSPDGKSLIQATASRLGGLTGDLLVVTSLSQVPLAREHLPSAKILAEPMPRNTAACIGYAAVKVLEEVGDVPMICLPADHLVSGVEELTRTLNRAVELTAADHLLITIGIPPLYPETGYGYIRRGAPLPHSEHSYQVQAFVEKPNHDRAQEYLASGEYFWNSGMFIWRASTIWSAIEQFLPKLADQLSRVRKLIRDGLPADECAGIFREMESISIDYGVMERAKNVVMLAGVGFRWSDVGSWSSWKDSIDDAHPSEERNVTQGEVILLDSTDTLAISSNKLIAGIGLRGLIVVETPDAILVCHRDSAQEVRKVVELLKQKNKEELL